MSLPSLIIVTGRPASGKTSLVHPLARAVRCPAICRDEIKEGLVNTIGLDVAGPPIDELGRRVYEIFFETVERLLRHGVTLVAEAAFQQMLWAPKLRPLCALARVRIIICTVDPQLARERYLQRAVSDPQREQIHASSAPQSGGGRIGPAIEHYDPPCLEVPTLTVDTSDGYRPEFNAIVAFARG